MGCDGGTIPKRDELVRTKKRQAQCPKEVKNAAKWNHCHLSELPLQKPIVADLLGNLYNKEAVIESLLDKSKYENFPEHIKGLKDIKELSLTTNPSYESNKQENGDEMNMANKSPWICPITGIEMNGNFKFYFLHSCGCVFSDRAYRTIPSGASKCIKCEKSFGENDLVIINPSAEDLITNQAKLRARKELAASKKAEKASTTSKASTSTDSSSKTLATSSKKISSDDSNSNLKQKRPIESSATNDAAKKQKGSSIQEDPNASEVYKSLFNTCDKAKKQTKAHWVSFNPFYN